MKKAHIYYGLALLLAAGGCSLREPIAPEKAQPAIECKLGMGSAALPEKWWESFEDEELSAVIEQALTGNFSLQASLARIEQARQSARQAGAAMIPAVSYSVDASRARSASLAGASYGNTNRASLIANYELDLWKRVSSARDAAVFEQEATAQDYLSAKLSLSAEIAQLWYAMRANALQKQVLSAQLTVNEQSLDLITGRFNNGKAVSSDVLSQKRLVEAVRGSLISNQADFESLEYSLCVLLGKAPGECPVPAALPFAQLSGQPEVPAEFIARRPDLAAAMSRISAQDRLTAVALAGKYPTLTLSATVYGQGDSADDIFNDWFGSLAAGLAGPLFDAGRRDADFELNKALLEEALAGYKQAVVAAYGEAATALSAEKNGIAYSGSVSKQLELARGVTKSVKQQYINGQLGYIYILNALETEQRLELTDIGARLACIQARIDLCRAIAGGWNEDNNS